MTAEEVDSLQAVVERVGVTQAYAVQRYDPSVTVGKSVYYGTNH